jgi:hypothetical protein
MRKKDIITLVVAVVIIGVSVYFMLQLLFPQENQANITSESERVQEVPESIDETTYETVKDLSDYGVPSLSELGKKDLFAGF